MKQQNPLERQALERANLLKQTREEFGDIFDEGKDERENTIEKMFLSLEIYEKEGIIFNKKEVIDGLRRSLEIQDKEEFIAHVLSVLGPIIEAKFTQPKNFEKATREIKISVGKLSKVLWAEFKDEKGIIEINLAPAKELIEEAGIGYLKKEVEIGLRKLAREVVLPNDKIKKILAKSWIVAKNPSLLERLGFTYDGIVSEKEDGGISLDNLGNKRSVAKAFMTRENFLARYGN